MLQEIMDLLLFFLNKSVYVEQVRNRFGGINDSKTI